MEKIKRGISVAAMESAEPRKSSITADELTPIVINQLQTATKKKEETRRQRREAAAAAAAAASKPASSSNLEVPLTGVAGDSGSESCGEESRMRTAAAFMSGIRNALGGDQEQCHEVNLSKGKYHLLCMPRRFMSFLYVQKLK